MARHHKSAKKKAQNFRDRMHEHEGMERYENRPHHYEDGIEDGRHGGRAMYEPSERRMEYRSGMMISEDRYAIANMPQHVVYEEYPKGRMYLRTNLDDTMSGIDMQQSEDVGMANRHKAKSMY
jgi:hypothetical protein